MKVGWKRLRRIDRRWWVGVFIKDSMGGRVNKAVARGMSLKDTASVLLWIARWLAGWLGVCRLAGWLAGWLVGWVFVYCTRLSVLHRGSKPPKAERNFHSSGS